ncbi:MAG: response regulator [Pseudomonadota bacterium]
MTTAKRLEGKKILLVDDEPDILETLEDLLSECETVRASSFEEARAALERAPFDIAVLDIMGVNGFDLLEIAAGRNIISVMLTAHALSPESIKRSVSGGADYYLPKEEMINIAAHLNDILDDRAKGISPWTRWMHRLGGFCESRFGPDWQKGDQIFWDKFPFH